MTTSSIIRLLITSLILCQLATAADWHLDASASAGGSGRTWANAWKTSEQIAWAGIKEGDTLHVRPGSYARLFIKGKKGVTVRIDPAATSPAIFSGPAESLVFGSEDILIDGRANGKNLFYFPGSPQPYTEKKIHSMMSITSSKRITIRGFVIDREKHWSKEVPVIDGIPRVAVDTVGVLIANNSGPSQDIVVEDGEIRFMTRDGVRIPPAKSVPSKWDTYVIRRCQIVNTGQDGVSFGANGVTVEDCIVDRNNQTAPLGSHMDGLQAIPRAKHIRVRGNFFTGWPMNIFIERSAGPVEVYNNIAVGRTLSDRCRAISASPSEFADAPFEGHWLVANNTFVDIWNFPAYLGAGSVKRVVPADKLVVGNNVFLNCKELYPSASQFGTSVDLSTDIYFNAPGVQYYKFTSSRTNMPVAVPRNQNAGNARKLDPLFANPAQNDFRLRSGSPAIGTGMNLSQYFGTDKNGKPRPRLGAWDVGAIAREADGLLPFLFRSRITTAD